MLSLQAKKVFALKKLLVLLVFAVFLFSGANAYYIAEANKSKKIEVVESDGTVTDFNFYFNFSTISFPSAGPIPSAPSPAIEMRVEKQDYPYQKERLMCDLGDPGWFGGLLFGIGSIPPSETVKTKIINLPATLKCTGDIVVEILEVDAENKKLAFEATIAGKEYIGSEFPELKIWIGGEPKLFDDKTKAVKAIQAAGIELKEDRAISFKTDDGRLVFVEATELKTETLDPGTLLKPHEWYYTGEFNAYIDAEQLECGDKGENNRLFLDCWGKEDKQLEIDLRASTFVHLMVVDKDGKDTPMLTSLEDMQARGFTDIRYGNDARLAIAKKIKPPGEESDEGEPTTPEEPVTGEPTEEPPKGLLTVYQALAYVDAKLVKNLFK